VLELATTGNWSDRRLDSELRQLAMRPRRGIPPFGDAASIHSASRTAMRIARDWRCGRRGSHVTGATALPPLARPGVRARVRGRCHGRLHSWHVSVPGVATVSGTDRIARLFDMFPVGKLSELSTTSESVWIHRALVGLKQLGDCVRGAHG
jgi:hypothetical protein